MFTGIITERGTVASLQGQGDSAVLTLAAPELAVDLPLGGSLAVNGVCLSLTGHREEGITLDLMGETLQRTNLGELKAGDLVNLERCVPVTGRLDGHIVQGHVDGVGVLTERENHGNWERLRFSIPPDLARYVTEKGSIALDGVSLTLTAVSPPEAAAPWIEVGLIPVTLAETGLGAKAMGEKVNIEVDILAKYTERMLAFGALGRGGATS